MCMIETVAHERFYKDVAHEPLRPAIPKDPRSHVALLLLQLWLLLSLPAVVVHPPPPNPTSDS
jgi:hypothetical protein